MGVADRARKRMPTAGDYLEKDDLIRDQEPFGVASCAYDEKGSNWGPRWVLSLIPWFEDQDEPKGLLTFTANPTRNPFFEDLQLQIEENGNEPIGPCVVIKGKSQKGYRYYTLDDWTDPETAPEAEQAPSPAPARPARPAASAPVQETAVNVAPETIPANGEQPKKRGRPRKTATTPAAEPVRAAEGSAVASPVAQVATPAVATVICPDCHQEVTGRVLPDDKGKNFVIHPYCPTVGKGTIIEVV